MFMLITIAFEVRSLFHKIFYNFNNFEITVFTIIFISFYLCCIINRRAIYDKLQYRLLLSLLS